MQQQLFRKDLSETFNSQPFDVCIIGGGATGAGCALDAQSRGLRTLLIEKNDFGHATSSKSTKLIHGGVRYLEQAVKKLSWGQFKMVKKALQERSTLLHLAPHVTRPLQLITPCRTWLEGAYYFIGLKMYDWLSGRSKIGGSELLGRKKAIERIPTLQKNNLYNAVLYYDGQLDDLRYNLALVQTAEELGAICINHCELLQFNFGANGTICGLQVKDHLTDTTYSIHTKVVINATGPFSDTIRLKANPTLSPRIKVSRGVHILLPKQMMPSSCALLIPKTIDGRLIFAIPYQKHLLVGTTDDSADLSMDDFGPNSAEIAYLLQYVNQYLAVNAQPKDVLAGFGGLRPLIVAGNESTKDLVRDHEVELDPQSGLFSILGGKWTTYRLMAKDAIDVVAPLLSNAAPCITHKIVLTGSQQFSHQTAIKLQQQTGCDHEIIKHLVSKYGDKAEKIGDLMLSDSTLKERLLPGMPYTYAELTYVVQKEKAFTVKDILHSRWGVQLANWQQTKLLLPIVGNWMAHFFNWNYLQKALYIEAYQNEIKQLIAATGMLDNIDL